MARFLVIPGIFMLIFGGLLVVVRGQRDYLPVVAGGDNFYERMEVHDPSDGSAHAFTPRYGARSLYTSNDGRWLYYKSVVGEHIGIDLATWQTHTMPFEARYELADAAHQADWLVVRSSLGDRLFRVQVDGSDMTDIMPSVRYVRGAWISPDDEWVVITAFDQRLYRLRPDGSDVAVLDEDVMVFGCWFADEWLLSWRGGRYYRINVERLEARPIAFDGGRTDVLACAAGNIVIRLDERLALMDPVSGVEHWSTAISPAAAVVVDGERVVWSEPLDDGRLQVSARHIVTGAEDVIAISPQPTELWQLAPNAVVFGVPEGEVVLISHQQQRPAALALVANSQQQLDRLEWSPDGKWVTFYRRQDGQYQLVRQNLADGTVMPIGSDRWLVAWTQIPDHGAHPMVMMSVGAMLMGVGAVALRRRA